MHTLTAKELTDLKGGFKLSFIITIVGIGAFLIGVIDGFINPIKCNK